MTPNGPKPLPEAMRTYYQDKLWQNFSQNTSIYIHENVLENVVCIVLAILFMPQCVMPFKSGKPRLSAKLLHLGYTEETEF